MDAKICGVKNIKILKYIVSHSNPPRYVGFICNYPKSKRNLNFDELKNLVNIKKSKKIKFVSVLVNPAKKTLNKIKKLKFDYLQLYNVSAKKTKFIKKDLNIKIITALTIKNLKDVMRYRDYSRISDIILFDSKGYEKSMGFNHGLLKNVPPTIKRMLAGNIQYNDNLEKFNKITDIIDLSGSLETRGEKDISKIKIFLKNLNKLKNEN